MIGAVIKFEVALFVFAVIFLVVLIISGRILAQINKSSCNSDSNIRDAHKWTAWVVALMSIALFLAIAGMVALPFLIV